MSNIDTIDAINTTSSAVATRRRKGKERKGKKRSEMESKGKQRKAKDTKGMQRK